jgi:hypothetical protein
LRKVTSIRKTYLISVSRPVIVDSFGGLGDRYHEEGQKCRRLQMKYTNSCIVTYVNYNIYRVNILIINDNGDLMNDRGGSLL